MNKIYSIGISSTDGWQYYSESLHVTPDWNASSGYAQILNKPNNFEYTSNRVTSISSASTDSQYPTAKCVYDIVGNIETLLQGI